MSLDFDWNERKGYENLRKHRVSFAEAMTAFSDPLSVTVPDPLHSLGEQRFVTLGISSRRRLLVVVHADLEEAVRIISARLTTPRERNEHEEGT